MAKEISIYRAEANIAGYRFRLIAALVGIPLVCLLTAFSTIALATPWGALSTLLAICALASWGLTFTNSLHFWALVTASNLVGVVHAVFLVGTLGWGAVGGMLLLTIASGAMVWLERDDPSVRECREIVRRAEESALAHD